MQLLAVSPHAPTCAVARVAATVLWLVDRARTVVEQDGFAGAGVVARLQALHDGAGPRAVVVLAHRRGAHVVGQAHKGIPLALVHGHRHAALERQLVLAGVSPQAHQGAHRGQRVAHLHASGRAKAHGGHLGAVYSVRVGFFAIALALGDIDKPGG